MAEAVVADSTTKPFTCDICQSTFSRKDYLSRHRARHSDKRPFKCSECGKDFKLQAYLSAHLKKVHSKRADDEPPRCVVCQKIFWTKAELAEHENDDAHKCLFCLDLAYRDYLESIKNKSGGGSDDVEEPAEPEKLQCEFCDMTFEEKIVMYHHLHTGHVDKVGVN